MDIITFCTRCIGDGFEAKDTDVDGFLFIQMMFRQKYVATNEFYFMINFQ
jgi:hypothetical protein